MPPLRRESKKFVDCDGAKLACTNCGRHLAAFPTNVEMEISLVETVALGSVLFTAPAKKSVRFCD